MLKEHVSYMTVSIPGRRMAGSPRRLSREYVSRSAMVLVLCAIAVAAQAQQERFRFQPPDTVATRIVESSLKIDMVMHGEEESGAVVDEPSSTTRTERRTARMITEDGLRFRFMFEKFSVDDPEADPEELQVVQTLLNKPYQIDLTDTSSAVSLHNDTVSVLERNFVENEYILFMMELLFSRTLEKEQPAIGDSLVLSPETASSLFQGLQFIDIEQHVTLRLVSIDRSEAGADKATFSFRSRAATNDESAFIELVSAGAIVVEFPSGRLSSISSEGTVEIIATENPETNRGSGAIVGRKLFTYPAAYKP
jgi:hypothetical protein